MDCGLAWRESLWPWEYMHMMPRQNLVRLTPKTAAEVALCLLTVTSVNGVTSKGDENSVTQSSLVTIPHKPMPSPNNKYNKIQRNHHYCSLQSHPQTNLPTCRSTHNPIPTRVEYRHRGNSRDAVAAELGQLVS